VSNNKNRVVDEGCKFQKGSQLRGKDLDYVRVFIIKCLRWRKDSSRSHLAEKKKKAGKEKENVLLRQWKHHD